MTPDEPFIPAYVQALYDAHVEEDRQADLRLDAWLDASGEVKAHGYPGATVTFRKVSE